MEKLFIIKLKERLREYALKISGGKSELIARLRGPKITEPFETETINMVDRSEDKKNLQDIPTTGQGNMEELRGDVLRLQRTMESLTQQIQTYMTMVSNMSLLRNSFGAEKLNCVFTCQPDIITQQQKILPENNNNNGGQIRIHEHSHS